MDFGACSPGDFSSDDLCDQGFDAGDIEDYGSLVTCKAVNGFTRIPGSFCYIPPFLVFDPPNPVANVPCGASITQNLTGLAHLDVVLRVLNENSYGLGYTDLANEDLNIASVLQNRATTPGAGNLNNGQDSRSIDNQARYAGDPSSTDYNYQNVSNLIAAKYNLALTSPDCQSFLRDISTANQAVGQVLSTGSVSTSVFFWYTKGYGPLPSYVGDPITTINNTTFYGLP